MLNRLTNALITRLVPAITVEIRRIVADERQREAKQVRELVGEMDDVLDKFTRVVAREAMRRSREMKKALEENPQASLSDGLDSGGKRPAPEELTGKAAIRARLRVGQRRPFVAEDAE